MSQRLLEGQVVDGNADAEFAQLSTRLREVNAELLTTREQLTQVTREHEKAMTALRILRRQLQPLYTSLQHVFDELPEGSTVADSAVGAVAGAGSVPSDGLAPRHKQILDSWKQRLGVGPGKIIDALLLHGAMNITQLATATGYNRSTVPQYLADLKKTGLIHKTGDNRFELKLP